MTGSREAYRHHGNSDRVLKNSAGQKTKDSRVAQGTIGWDNRVEQQGGSTRWDNRGGRNNRVGQQGGIEWELRVGTRGGGRRGGPRGGDNGVGQEGGTPG